MPQFELVDVGTATVRLEDVSLAPETVWRPLDDTRISEIEQNIMEGNWLSTPIEFPVLLGKSNGECFDAKACQCWLVQGGGRCTHSQSNTHVAIFLYCWPVEPQRAYHSLLQVLACAEVNKSGGQLAGATATVVQSAHAEVNEPDAELK